MSENAGTETCKCVQCHACRGSRNIRVRCDGYPEWDLETCPECDGEGITEVCDYCRDAQEDYWDEAESQELADLATNQQPNHVHRD